MNREAFTGGVKPGGLNLTTQIRILLCNLIHLTKKPLSPNEIEIALISEELVNCFELSDALVDLEANGFAVLKEGRYILTEKGINISDILSCDVPKSVRECAIRAVIKAQQFTLNAASHKAEITLCGNGYKVDCSIVDMGEVIFSFSVYLPDYRTAEYAKNCFIEGGDNLYRVMLAGITGNYKLAAELLN